MSTGKSPEESLRNFLKSKASTGYRRGGRDRKLPALSSSEIVRIVQLALEDPAAIEDLVVFAKTHKKVAKSLTEADVTNVLNELDVKKVMES